MLLVAGCAAGWHAWRKPQRDDIAVAVFLLGIGAIELLRWWVAGAAPTSAGWYADATLLLAESAAPAALALFVLARRSVLPAIVLLVVALATLGYEPRTVTWLYKATDLLAAAMALLCIIPLWQRRARPTLAVLVTLLFVAVLVLGAVADVTNLSDERIWRAHLAAEVCIFILAAVFYFKGSLGNGEAS